MSLASIEAARILHEHGMRELQEARFGEFIHPVGALSVVHNVLVLPLQDEVDHLNLAYEVLDTRLRQPDALRYRPEPGFFARHLDRSRRAFVALNPPELLEGSENIQRWQPAIKLIARPIEPSELALPETG
jgi:hypothetical protein